MRQHAPASPTAAAPAQSRSINVASASSGRCPDRDNSNIDKVISKPSSPASSSPSPPPTPAKDRPTASSNLQRTFNLETRHSTIRDHKASLRRSTIPNTAPSAAARQRSSGRHVRSQSKGEARQPARSPADEDVIDLVRRTCPESIRAMAMHDFASYSPSSPSPLSAHCRRFNGPKPKFIRPDYSTPNIACVALDDRAPHAATRRPDSRIPFVSSASQAFIEDIEPRSPGGTLLQQWPSTPRGLRPKIQVVIPYSQRTAADAAGQFARPVPHQLAIARQLASQSEPSTTIDISPPSSTTIYNGRTSAVSPLVPLQLPRPRRLVGKQTQSTLYECLDEEDPPHLLSLSQEGLNSKASDRSLSTSSASSRRASSDDGSCYDDEDDNSSTTSVESATPINRLSCFHKIQKSGLAALALETPVGAGVFADGPSRAATSKSFRSRRIYTDSRPPTPPPKPEVIQIGIDIRPIAVGSQRQSQQHPTPPAVRVSSPRSNRSPSPTISMLEKEIHEQLTILTECSSPSRPPTAKSQTSQHSPVAVAKSHIAAQSVQTKQDPTAKPVQDKPLLPNTNKMVPASHSPKATANSRRPTLKAAPKQEKRKSQREELMQAIDKLSIPPRVSGGVTEVNLATSVDAERLLLKAVSPEDAEQVVLKIFESLTSFEDLFATAQVNKGFHEVYKRNELVLMRNALQQSSPAAWERREITTPDEAAEESPDSAEPVPEYSPKSYFQCYQRELAVITQLKQLILSRCKNFLRPETKQALEGSDFAGAARVDNAFWRIWTFCRIFGGGRGREYDVVGQIDWLKGGVLAHEEQCTSTVFGRDSVEGSDVLLSAPECFGRGNPNGLTAEQLYDITEMWTCLGVLIQGFGGRTAQAREHGVFANTDACDGDEDKEEHLLEEWYYHLLTLGLDCVAELAESNASTEPTAFQHAKSRGWMDWTPSAEGQSRSTFLKDAVSRVYEEKIVSISSSNRPKRQELLKITRERIQGHAAEIKLRKQARDLKVIRMSMERPMSEWENVMHVLDHSAMPAVPSRRADAAKRLTGSSGSDSVASSSRLPGRPELPSSASSSKDQRRESESSSASDSSAIHPALRQRQGSAGLTPSSALLNPSRNASRESLLSNASNQHPRQQALQESVDRAENTAEKAIFRIVEMGFTADEAKHALRVTDMGDGLRIDRAVELLLRRQT